MNKNIIQRMKITAEIDRFSKKGILFVHSPAGYGKTTAVALWAQGKKTAWISIDEYSCEPAEIYKRLLLALSCKVSAEFDDSPLEYTLDILQKLENWPGALIIDDFHLCNNLNLRRESGESNRIQPQRGCNNLNLRRESGESNRIQPQRGCNDYAVARALPLIRSRIPASTAFIIISRSPPPEILIDQTLKGRINQINSLHFSDNEIITLFNKNQMHITKYEAEIIRERTHGWAAALSAILLSNKNFSSGMLNSETLNDYLRTHVFDYRDDYQVLKKCSVCDILYPALCRAITGRKNAWDIITSFAAKTGLVIRTGSDTYRFHALLKEFLESELVCDETINEPLLYKTAARRFKKDGDILRAINMAAKSRDIAMVEAYLRARDEYGKFAADIEENTFAIINYVYSEMPVSVIKQSLRLSWDCVNALFCLGRLQEGYELLDAAKVHVWSEKKYTQMDIIATALLQCTDPRENICDIPEIINRVNPLLAEAKTGKMPTFTVTINFPFFHRSEIDFSDASPQLDEFMKKLKNYLGHLTVFTPLILLIEAGLRYERGEIAQAEKTASETVQIAQFFPPELHFCALILYAEIMRVQGKSYQPEPIRTMITKRNAHYLSANFNAFTANIQLYNGDEDTANHWLSQFEVEDTLRVYKMYQYFTAARSLMVLGKLSDAETLLQRIIDVSPKYRRPADHIEAQVLRSVCFWNMKRQTDSIQAMIDAISKAHELQLVMPITREGGDILPVLKNILNRLKYGYDTDILDKSFVNKLFYGAEAMSHHRGIMVKKNKNKPVKLTSRQLEILMFLEQNFSYREISEKLGIKVTTVDDHIDKLYEKLEVSNARDAVLKARELRIGL